MRKLKDIIKKDIVKVGFFAGAAALCVAIPYGIIYLGERANEIRDKRISSGYVIPSKLEAPIVKDLDKKDGNEVLLKYKGKSFLLMEDKFGNPVIKEYTLIPAENPKIIIKK